MTTWTNATEPTADSWDALRPGSYVGRSYVATGYVEEDSTTWSSASEASPSWANASEASPNWTNATEASPSWTPQ